MAIKDQFAKIKENWLIVVLILVLLFFTPIMSSMSNLISRSAGIRPQVESAVYYDEVAERAVSKSYAGGTDFAPEVIERKITKTASLTTEVERGTFHESESKLKNIITSSGSYLLNENVNKYGTKRKSYYTGNYQIKIDTKKYDSVASQLKEIGELKTFNEQATDITGGYTNVEIELEVELDRLKRYESMYREATKVEDKIDLNDRIFNQERRIKYLKDQISRMDERVDYSTISFTITEKRSEYINVEFVKFSELIRNIVNSINSLFRWIFVLAPWAVAVFIIRFIWKRIKKKK